MVCKNPPAKETSETVNFKGVSHLFLEMKLYKNVRRDFKEITSEFDLFILAVIWNYLSHTCCHNAARTRILGLVRTDISLCETSVLTSVLLPVLKKC